MISKKIYRRNNSWKVSAFYIFLHFFSLFGHFVHHPAMYSKSVLLVISIWLSSMSKLVVFTLTFSIQNTKYQTDNFLFFGVNAKILCMSEAKKPLSKHVSTHYESFSIDMLVLGTVLSFILLSFLWKVISIVGWFFSVSLV